MFSLTIFVLSSLSSIISASDYLLILDHKDVANGFFSSDLKNDGLENENDPTANTYSIIGNFNDDAALQSQYKDNDGKFAFKLIYRYDDGTNDTLIWRQSSWIADANVTGADLSEIPDQSGKEAAAQFYGLALSSYSATYIDGTGDESLWWYHSVGSNTAWGPGGGIPGDRRYETAYSSSLYLLNPTIKAETTTEAPVNCGYELILEHKDTASGYFGTSIRTTGLENEDDPTANTYSIIGNLNTAEYLDNNGDYLFKMIYFNDDDAISDGSPENYTLIWKQSSWLTATGVQGYKPVSLPTMTNSGAAKYYYFVGLSLSSYSSYVYLDGIAPSVTAYRNAAGYFGTSNVNIPAYDGEFATGQQLFIWNDKDCVTTQPPTTGAPTPDPTTSQPTAAQTTTCDIENEVVNDYPLSNLNNWTLCYHQAYNAAMGTTTESLPNCETGDDYLLFVAAKESHSAENAYVGAYGPSSVLTTNTDSTSIAYKPSMDDYPNYNVYWYNNIDVAYGSFGFAPNATINLASGHASDSFDPNNEQRLSWRLEGYGGRRAGSNGYLDWSSTWYKTVYYKYCPAETTTEAPVNCGYELILEHKDTASGYFDSSIRTTGLENEDDPTANTYSIIGNLNTADYLDNNGDYLFKMIYYNDDDAISSGSPENYTLIWKQSSWLTNTGVQGYEAVSLPTMTNSGAAKYYYFVGLSLSSYSSYVYLDGIAAGITAYRNAAGYFGTSNVNIPAYNGEFATGQQLFIWNDKDCATTQPPTTGAPTSETTTNAGTTKDTTTESPIIEPSILPTADPTTSQPTTAQPTTPEPTIADDCVLIMEHKDVADGYFSADSKDTGLENENDPTANTYSIIGLFNDDQDLRDQYKDDNGNYKFKLIYGYDDDTIDTFIWTQKSWIADVNITGANLTQIPDQSGKHSAAVFYGLALSNSDRAYLDGTGTQVGIWWFHAIGSNTPWLGGIPADRWNYPAQNSSLCIYEPPTSTDCSILDIDAYLSDCSVVFQSNELEDEAMEQEIESLDERVTTIEEQIEQCGCSSSSASGSSGKFIDDKSPSVGANLLSNGSKDTLIIALVLINIFTIVGGCYVFLLFYTKSPRVEFMKYDKVDVHYQEETETEEN